MSKRIISIILALTLALSVLGFSAVSVSAATDTATVTVGGEKHTVQVGEFFKYTLSMTYVGQKLTTGQIELPVDFGGLNSYTQSEADAFISEIAPVSTTSSVCLRSDTKNSFGLKGYVMNFANPNGYSFTTSKAIFSLIFSVEKAGSYDLAAKIRYVEDIAGNTIVDKNYKNNAGVKFSYTEKLESVNLDTPAISVATAAGGMRISWNPVPRAAVYRVYYKGSNGWTRMVDTTETSYLDTDVKGGTRYTYTVRCLSADKKRFTSDYDRSGKSAVYYPAPKLSLSADEDSIGIKWSAVSGASKYRLYRMERSGWTRVIDTASTSYSDTNVSSGNTYTYTIRTLNSSGSLLSSYYADGFKLTYLSAPEISLSNVADGVKISWKKLDGAEKYRVYYKGSKGWTRMVDTAETSYIDKDVSSNHNYTYTVRCINKDATAFTSYFRSGNSILYVAAPKLSLSPAADGVDIKWSAVAGAAKYRVYVKGTNGWTKITDTTSTSCTDNDVVSGKSYIYTIRAMNSSNQHLSYYYTDGFKIDFVSAPTVSLSNVADGVKISWNKPEGAEKFRVYYYGSKGWTRLTETTETSFIDKDVSSNHNFTYTVRCVNKDSTAFTSNFRAGKKILYVAAPKLTLSSAANGVNIKWNAVAGAAKYRVYRKGANGWAKLTDTTSTSYVDTNVAKGTSYVYTIRCMNSSDQHLSYYYTDGFKITYNP